MTRLLIQKVGHLQVSIGNRKKNFFPSKLVCFELLAQSIRHIVRPWLEIIFTNITRSADDRREGRGALARCWGGQASPLSVVGFIWRDLPSPPAPWGTAVPSPGSAGTSPHSSSCSAGSPPGLRSPGCSL